MRRISLHQYISYKRILFKTSGLSLICIKSSTQLPRNMNKFRISMKPFSKTINRCNAAHLMLAMWVFVLASGFANACLLKGPATVFNKLAVKVGNAYGASAASDHLEPIDHHGDKSSRAPCLKACDEGAQALQAHPGADPVNPGSAPLVAIVWEPIPVTSTPHQIADSQLSWRDPPQRIRYSRWAL